MVDPTLSGDGSAGPNHQHAVHPLPADQVLDALRGYAVFALDGDGRVASWNQGARRLTGYEEKEICGQPYTVFGAHENAGDLARVLQSAQDSGTFHQERWLRHRDGGLVWVDELINPLDSAGYVVITRDLTERAAAEERQSAGAAREAQGRDREIALRAELQAAERRAAFLAEASSILVATSLDFDSTLRALARLAVSRLADWCSIHSLDEDGDLVRAEVAHRDPQLEQPLIDTIDHGLTERWEQTVRSVISTGQAQILTRNASGSWFTLSGDAPGEIAQALAPSSAMVTPLMGRGKVLGAMTLVTRDPDHEYDEDDLHLAEELGRRAAIALDNARLYRDAQEANRAKADFLAVMSHELRTPLNAIMGYSDLLDAEISGDLTDRQRRQIDRIRASARHLLQLIEEILSFARIESGGEEVRPALAEAQDIAQEAAAVIEPMATSKGLAFHIDAPADPITLETDPGKARQILVNLLSNAVKFTERGTVTLRVRVEGERVVFDVTDTGIGIPGDQMGRIFDPFWQVERPNTRRAGGTGLGLSVSRRYVRLLHGELKVDSEPGRGTTFSVVLPLRLTGAKRGSTKA
jgi:PAS domain S-box-containing protein